MVVGGRRVAEGEDEKSRKKGNPGEQEEDRRGIDFLDSRGPVSLLL